MSNMEIPPDILEVIQKLDPEDQATMMNFINEKASGSENVAAEIGLPKDDGDISDDDDEMKHAQAGEHFVKASNFKEQGMFEEALEEYDMAMEKAVPYITDLLVTDRAEVRYELGMYQEAIRDCDWALEDNPNHAKALAIRKKSLEDWENASQIHAAISYLNRAPCNYSLDAINWNLEGSGLRLRDDIGANDGAADLPLLMGLLSELDTIKICGKTPTLNDVSHSEARAMLVVVDDATPTVASAAATSTTGTSNVSPSSKEDNSSSTPSVTDGKPAAKNKNKAPTTSMPLSSTPLAGSRSRSKNWE